MGKVKDGAPASKTAKPSKGGPTGGTRRRFVQFLANLVRPDLYKPRQGWHARVYTAGALGLVLAVGIWKQFEALNDYQTLVRYAVPAALGLTLGWFIFRLVQYPPFVEFLIATEAEMNKVSWTSKDDLYRATTVVLVTVVLMAVFLFGVDWVWSTLLQILGVLRFGSGGSLGSTA
jgi:preprotein translocase subunit SecE